MKELKGETKIIITDLTLDAIFKMFKTPEEKESFKKCWGWGMVEWQPLILCDDCKHMEFDEEYKDYYCAKKGSANRIKVSHDFYCKDGEAK